VFFESDDPNRLGPIVWKPEDYMIAVTGDPLRNNAYVFAQNGFLGYPTGKKIELPEELALLSCLTGPQPDPLGHLAQLPRGICPTPRAHASDARLALSQNTVLHQ
jgi:hypothetical protein